MHSRAVKLAVWVRCIHVHVGTQQGHSNLQTGSPAAGYYPVKKLLCSVAKQLVLG
jgi:TRAP-type uncharacterized transport system substrate-binding protein